MPLITGARPIRALLIGSVCEIPTLPITNLSPYGSGVKFKPAVRTRRTSAVIKCESSWTITPGSNIKWNSLNAKFLLFVILRKNRERCRVRILERIKRNKNCAPKIK